MAKKKTETKVEKKFEREYTIPLREKCRPVPRYKKTPKAIKTIKEFLVRHMKIRDRDLNKIKIDKYLNEALWFRGIKNPPYKIKVKATKDGENIRVELIDFSNKLKYKKLREEKQEKVASEASEKKKKEKPAEEKPTEQKTEEQKAEEKEKAKSGEEATKQLEKTQAKQAKHISGGKTKEPKHQKRKALAK